MPFLQILVVVASVGLVFFALRLVAEGIEVTKRIKRVSSNIQRLKAMYDETMIAEFRGLLEDVQSIQHKTEDVVATFRSAERPARGELEMGFLPSFSELIEGHLKEFVDTLPLLRKMYSFLAGMVFPRGIATSEE